MRLIKILLILPILVYGGLKGYIWYDVKKNMDELIASSAPFAEITYESVISSLVDGVVGVEGIVIRPMMTNDEFTIQEINISAPSILDILFMGSRFKDKELPEHVGFEMKNIGVDLNSKIFVMLNNMQAQAAMQQQQGAPLLVERIDALGCGDVKKFGLNEITAMGYDKMELDFSFNVEFQKAAQEMKVDIHVKDPNLYDVNLAIQFPFDLDKIKSGTSAASDQAITHMSVEYTDTGYYKLRNRYCARLNGGTVDEYIDANISRLTAELGAAFPAKVVDSYRHFLKSGGTVNVSMNPLEATKLSDLSLYKTSDVLYILGMAITINGNTIDNEKIAWNGRQVINEKAKETNVSSKQQVTRPAIVRPASSKSVSKPKSQPSRKKAEYRSVNKEKISKYIGKRIKVVTSDGRERRGLLESVDENRIRVLMRFGSGEFSFPVKRHEITNVKVYL